VGIELDIALKSTRICSNMFVSRTKIFRFGGTIDGVLLSPPCGVGGGDRLRGGGGQAVSGASQIKKYTTSYSNLLSRNGCNAPPERPRTQFERGQIWSDSRRKLRLLEKSKKIFPGPKNNSRARKYFLQNAASVKFPKPPGQF